MSTEYEISLQSAHAVICQMATEKYNPILVGIAKEGRWLHFHGDLCRIPEDTWHKPDICTPAFLSPCWRQKGLMELHKDGTSRLIPLDAAFPVMHGAFGEDGTVQGLLELAGIPIVGCGTLASALCMDKNIAHVVAKSAGITVPNSYMFARSEPMARIHHAAKILGYPLFSKPVCAGSSFGVSRVESEQALQTAIQEAFRHDTRFLLEEAIDGFEMGCAILGNDQLMVGEVDEIELAGGFFDYTEKYNMVTSKVHVPARISAKQAVKIKETAVLIYRALGCKGFARVDMFLQTDGTVVFNEINTIPGFTAHSRYPSMMKCTGLEFADLVDKLIETAGVKDGIHENKDDSPGTEPGGNQRLLCFHPGRGDRAAGKWYRQQYPGIGIHCPRLRP